MITTIFLVTVIAVFLICSYRNYLKQYEDINKLPGPSTFRLIKDLYFSHSREGIMNYFQTLNKKYGPVVKLWIKPLKPMIITTDMEYCNRIYKANDHHITPILFEMSFLGEGIASNLDYETWKQDKQIIKKAVTKDYIAKRLFVYSKKYDEFLDLIRNGLGKPIDVQQLLHKILLHIVLYSLNDPRVDLSENEVDVYLKYKRDFFELLLEKMNSFRMIGLLHRLTKNYKLIMECKNDIVKFGQMWLERFKKVEEHLREEHNIVYALLNAGVPDNRVVDNINTMMQGAHDTSILPLSLTFQEMANRPELQYKVFDEILNVMGPDINKPVTLEDVGKMPYLHAVVKESVRMYFPVPLLDRRLLYDMTINNTKIPKDTVVMFYFPGILRSSVNYDDPDTFNPDRFLKENVTAKAQKAYVGFGYGLKACPGKHIAYAAMKLLIIKVIREFQICPMEEKYEAQFVSEVFTRSLNGIPIVFKKRIFA